MQQQCCSGPARRAQRGFTIIELLIVMAILGLLAVMVAPHLFNQADGARRDAVLSQIPSLESPGRDYTLMSYGAPWQRHTPTLSRPKLSVKINRPSIIDPSRNIAMINHSTHSRSIAEIAVG